MKKTLLVTALFIAFKFCAAEAAVYGDFQQDTKGMPQKWSLTSKAAGTVEVIADGDHNAVLLCAEKKGDVGILSIAVPGKDGEKFKVTARINGDPCEIQFLQYNKEKKFCGAQKFRCPARKNAEEVSRVFTVNGTGNGPVETIRISFRVYRGAGCSVSGVRLEKQ